MRGAPEAQCVVRGAEYKYMRQMPRRFATGGEGAAAQAGHLRHLLNPQHAPFLDTLYNL